jgi:Tfp pilus assembly protein PilE
MAAVRNLKQPNQSRKGQTMVEYLMLLVVVVGLFFVFQKFTVPWFNNIFMSSKQEVEKTAMRGGEAAIQNYYADSNKRVMGK